MIVEELPGTRQIDDDDADAPPVPQIAAITVVGARARAEGGSVL